MKKTIAIVLTLIMLIAAFGCSKPASTATETKTETKTEVTTEAKTESAPSYTFKKIYSIGSGTSGSAFVPYCTALGDIFTKYVDGMNVSVEPGSSSGNQISLHNKEVDFGIISSLQVYEGAQGIASWANGVKYNDLYSFIPAYSYEACFFTLKSAGYTDIRDFEGKILAVGAAGSGSDNTGRQLVDYFGINVKELVNGSWTDLAGQLQDGLIDGIFYLAGHPVSFATELEITTELNVFSLNDEDMAKFVGDNPYYVIGTVPAGTYKALTEDLKVLQGWNFIGISTELPDDLVYDLTKTVWEHVDVIHAAGKSYSMTALENVCKMNMIVHPGAARYYSEIGVELPSVTWN